MICLLNMLSFYSYISSPWLLGMSLLNRKHLWGCSGHSRSIGLQPRYYGSEGMQPNRKTPQPPAAVLQSTLGPFSWGNQWFWGPPVLLDTIIYGHFSFEETTIFYWHHHLWFHLGNNIWIWQRCWFRNHHSASVSFCKVMAGTENGDEHPTPSHGAWPICRESPDAQNIPEIFLYHPIYKWDINGYSGIFHIFPHIYMFI